MVIPQPMSQKNRDFEPVGPIYGQNTVLRARWQWALCLVTYQGDLAVFGRVGVKYDPKKKVSKCVWGYFGGGIYDVSGWFCRILALQTSILVLYHAL